MSLIHPHKFDFSVSALASILVHSISELSNKNRKYNNLDSTEFSTKMQIGTGGCQLEKNSNGDRCI